MTKDHLSLIGISYKTASIETREAWYVSTNHLIKKYLSFKSCQGDCSLLILSTCNRFEFYLMGPVNHSTLEKLLPDGDQVQNDLVPFMKPAVYQKQGQHAIDHLFKVAAGLDSMVIGENQILGQLKSSYELAKQCDCIRGPMHRLIQHAIKVGKQVRSQTTINQEKCSISSLACQVVEQACGQVQHKKVLLIGTGSVAVQTLKLLKKKKVASIIVANRQIEHARQLAKKMNGQAINFKQLPDYLRQVNFIISCTAAPHYILRPAHFEASLTGHGGQKLVAIDLALPRDIDPKVNQLKQVKLINLDQLQDRCSVNEHKRIQAKQACLDIITQEKKKYMKQSLLNCQFVNNLLPTKQMG